MLAYPNHIRGFAIVLLHFGRGFLRSEPINIILNAIFIHISVKRKRNNLKHPKVSPHKII